MDADLSRVRFIERELQRALETSDVTEAVKAARELRRYMEWFKESIPEPERERIAGQLLMLESKLARREEWSLRFRVPLERSRHRRREQQ
jgi:hypothetical protein